MTDIIEDRGRGFLIEIGEELSRLRAENSALKAEVAALKAHDPLAEMWAALEEYQPFANRDGHGESWARMCSERTTDAADSAEARAWEVRAARGAAAEAVAYAGRAAVKAASAAWAAWAYRGAAALARREAWATKARTRAAEATAAIRRAKEVKP